MTKRTMEAREYLKWKHNLIALEKLIYYIENFKLKNIIGEL